MGTSNLHIPLTLYQGHLKSSKRTLLISAIGLIIALSLVTSSLYYIDNSRHQLIVNSLNSTNNSGNDIVIDLTSDYSNTKPNLTSINSTISHIINKYGYNFINTSDTKISNGLGPFMLTVPQITIGGGINNGLNYQNQFARVYQITPYIEKEIKLIYSLGLNTGPSNLPENLPQSNTTAQSKNLQAFMIDIQNTNYYTNLVTDYNSLFANNTLQIYNTQNSGILSNNSYSLNITGYANIKLDYYYNNYPNQFSTGSYSNDATAHVPYIRELATGNTFQQSSVNTLFFVSNLTEFRNLVNSYKQNANTSNFHLNNEYKVHLAFDYSNINLNDIGSFVSQENFFGQRVTTDFINQGFSEVSLNYVSSNQFQYIQDQINVGSLNLFINDLPILIISLFFIFYSFNLIYKDVITNIGIFKTRGASTHTIMFFYIIDTIIVFFLSLFLSVLVGIPPSILTLKSDFILSFNKSVPQGLIFNYDSILNTTIIVAILFILLSNTNRIRKLSKLQIRDTENPIENENPFWKKHYIDFILVIYSLVMFSLIYLINNNQDISRALNGIIFIFILLLLPSPFAFIIGINLLLNRFIPKIINFSGTKLWYYSGGLLAYAIKNLLRYKNATIRAVLITATIIAFMTLFYSQPYTSLENYKLNIDYQTGADGVVYFANNQYNQTIIQYLESNYSQYIEGVCPFLYAYSSASTNFGSGQSMKFLLVNVSNYIQVANLNFDLGLQKNLQTDFSNLKISNETTPLTPIKMLIDQSVLAGRSESIGSNITVSTTNGFFQRFQVQDSFKNWPYIASNSIYNPGINYENFNAIIDINYFLNTLHGNVAGSIFQSVTQTGAFIKFKDNANLTTAISSIQNNLPMRFSNVPKLNIEAFQNSYSFLGPVSQINLSIIFSFIIIFFVILLFIYLQLSERNVEIHTELALGLKHKQLSTLFFIENIVFIIFSIIIGNVFGYILVDLIAFVSTSPFQQYPVSSAIVPFNIILITDIIIILEAALLSIIPVIYVLKKDLSESFISDMRRKY